jgi:hypothetical protein
LRLSSRWISAHRGGDGLAWCRPQRSAASSALSVIQPTMARLNPALASRFKVNRTVDGATPTRRAISLSPTPAVLKRSTSRTWFIHVLSVGIHSVVDVDFFPGIPCKWGLGYMINTQPGPNGCSAGSVTWAGIHNTYYWLDPLKRVAGVPDPNPPIRGHQGRRALRRVRARCLRRTEIGLT